MGVNSYVFVNGVEIYKSKAKDSEVNAVQFCLGSVSNDFWVDNMKKTVKDYIDLSMIFLYIMTVLMLMVRYS